MRHIIFLTAFFLLTGLVPAMAAPPVFCSPPNGGASCLTPANNRCSQIGMTTLDGDQKNLVACLAGAAGNNCAAGQCQWKSMTMTSIQEPRVCSGIANTTFFNGVAHSTPQTVSFPAECLPCNNPRVFTQTVSDSIACGNGTGPTNCSNNPGTTSSDLHAYFHTVSSTGFQTVLSADDGVWVGATSPLFKINWMVFCDP